MLKLYSRFFPHNLSSTAQTGTERVEDGNTYKSPRGPEKQKCDKIICPAMSIYRSPGLDSCPGMTIYSSAGLGMSIYAWVGLCWSWQLPMDLPLLQIELAVSPHMT